MLACVRFVFGEKRRRGGVAIETAPPALLFFFFYTASPWGSHLPEKLSPQMLQSNYAEVWARLGAYFLSLFSVSQITIHNSQ